MHPARSLTVKSHTQLLSSSGMSNSCSIECPHRQRGSLLIEWYESRLIEVAKNNGRCSMSHDESAQQHQPQRLAWAQRLEFSSDFDFSVKVQVAGKEFEQHIVLLASRTL